MKGKELVTSPPMILAHTKLPHDELIQNLNDIVDFAFNGGNQKKDGNRKYLTVRRSSTFWTRTKHGKNS